MASTGASREIASSAGTLAPAFHITVDNYSYMIYNVNKYKELIE